MSHPLFCSARRAEIQINPSGAAVQSEMNGLGWIFTATENVELTPGMQIDAYAYDIANNLTIESLVLS